MKRDLIITALLTISLFGMDIQLPSKQYTASRSVVDKTMVKEEK